MRLLCSTILTQLLLKLFAFGYLEALLQLAPPQLVVVMKLQETDVKSPMRNTNTTTTTTLEDIEGTVFLVLGMWLFTVRRQILFGKKLKAARRQTAEANRTVC